MNPTLTQRGTLAWQKANRSLGSGACVEVAKADGTIVFRDSKDPDGPVLKYTETEFSAFVHGIKQGEFDHFC